MFRRYFQSRLRSFVSFFRCACTFSSEAYNALVTAVALEGKLDTHSYGSAKVTVFRAADLYAHHLYHLVCTAYFQCTSTCSHCGYTQTPTTHFPHASQAYQFVRLPAVTIYAQSQASIPNKRCAAVTVKGSPKQSSMFCAPLVLSVRSRGECSVMSITNTCHFIIHSRSFRSLLVRLVTVVYDTGSLALHAITT